MNGWYYIVETTIQPETIEEIIASIQRICVNELESEVEAYPTPKSENTDSNDTSKDTLNFFPRISYSFQEEEFRAGLQYNTPTLDYEKLWYGENKHAGAGYVSEYVTDAPADTDSEMLSVQEAAETFMEIQYSAIMGNVYEVSGEKRRQFNLWIAFNPALFKLFESTQGLTRDVNYSMM